MKHAVLALSACGILVSCGTPQITKLKPIGAQNFITVADLRRVIECDLIEGISYGLAKGKDLEWVKDIKFAINYTLTVADSKGLKGNVSISTPVGGLLKLGATASNSRTGLRVMSFNLIMDYEKLPPCTKDDPTIGGNIGFVDWQKWLIDSYYAAKVSEKAGIAHSPFDPKEASFAVSFGLDKSATGAPTFTNGGSGAIDTIGGTLSRGRKITHKITVTAEEMIERGPEEKKEDAHKERNRKLLEQLDRKVEIQVPIFFD